MWRTTLLLCTAVAVCAQGPLLIHEIRLKGAQLTLPSDAILAASGLRKGQTVTQADIEEAARRLVDTGYLSFANFTYETTESGGKQSASLTFDLTEAPRDTIVVLDFPGTSSDQIWNALKASNSLFTGSMPATDAATRYAIKALEKVVGAEVESMLENDLKAKANTIVFHLKFSPLLDAIEVSGNKHVSNASVLGTISRLGIGQPYSDRRFQRLVELNVRPVYERLGRLDLKFLWLPPVKQDNLLTARFEIMEGAEYRLGQIQFTGEPLEPEEMRIEGGFRQGIANWEEIEQAARKSLTPLRAKGYLSASARIVRNLRPDAGLVDLVIEVKRGQQFIFGSLRVEGLPDADRQLAQTNLRLKPGEPFNQVYLQAYLRDYVATIATVGKEVTQDILTRQGSTIVDLVWRFK